MSDSCSILVVEDNRTTSRTLVLFLNSQGYRTRCAFSGCEALDILQDAPFDLVLLDLMLPDLDGLEVCRRIREQSSVPIVMLTARSTEDDIVEGLEAGALDYVCKPFGSRELLARIRVALRDRADQPAQRNSLTIGDIEIDVDERTVTVSGEKIRLTRTEFEILALLMANPGRVFTRDQIITRALGPDFDGFDRTVDTHVWSLRKKIGEPRGAPRYIHSELGVGYRLSDARKVSDES